MPTMHHQGNLITEEASTTWVQTAYRVLAVLEGRFLRVSQSPTLGTLATTCLVDAAVTEVHAASHGTYGARPVYAELTLCHGIAVGHSCIESLMRAGGVKGLPGIKRARSKQQTSTASDLVDRKFTREEPNELWVTDITEHPSARRKNLLRC